MTSQQIKKKKFKLKILIKFLDTYCFEDDKMSEITDHDHRTSLDNINIQPYDVIVCRDDYCDGDVTVRSRTQPVNPSVRYSDSYVTNKNIKQSEKNKKTRSVYVDCDVQRADSFKYKPTNSSLYRSRQTDKQAKVENKNKKNPKQDIDVNLDEKKKKTEKETHNNNSYLKRVKSKIYKHKNEGTDDEKKVKKMKEKKTQVKNSKIPKISDIPEEREVNIKKSTSTLFLRQYSNLERVRPRTFGPKNIGISDLVDSTTNILQVPVEQPKLTKSKSSSAINLNLLRSRRNKIQEQSKNCKNADTEFSFFAYNNGKENRGLCSLNKKSENNTQQKERPSSWIFGGEREKQG